jgi:type I restriction enzyme, S subunit
VPPVPEQHAIADFLDRETARIDRLITKQEQLIDTLRELRMAVIIRETGWSGGPPSGWSMQRLSWLFAATGSGTTPAPDDILEPDSATIPWVTTTELRETRITGTASGVSQAIVDAYSALQLVPSGSLLIAMYGATIGRMAILGVPATCNQACCALIGPTRATAEFVQYSLLAARERLLLVAAGGGQPNVNQEKIRAFRVPLPTIEEQGAIVARLDEQTAKIDTLIAKAEEFIALSKERRSALITAAVTGQIDVRDKVS